MRIWEIFKYKSVKVKRKVINMDQVMYDVKPKHKHKLDYVFHFLLICFALNMVVLY